MLQYTGLAIKHKERRLELDRGDALCSIVKSFKATEKTNSIPHLQWLIWLESVLLQSVWQEQLAKVWARRAWPKHS